MDKTTSIDRLLPKDTNANGMTSFTLRCLIIILLVFVANKRTIEATIAIVRYRTMKRDVLKGASVRSFTPKNARSEEASDNNVSTAKTNSLRR